MENPESRYSTTRNRRKNRNLSQIWIDISPYRNDLGVTEESAKQLKGSYRYPERQIILQLEERNKEKDKVIGYLRGELEIDQKYADIQSLRTRQNDQERNLHKSEIDLLKVQVQEYEQYNLGDIDSKFRDSQARVAQETRHYEKINLGLKEDNRLLKKELGELNAKTPSEPEDSDRLNALKEQTIVIHDQKRRVGSLQEELSEMKQKLQESGGIMSQDQKLGTQLKENNELRLQLKESESRITELVAYNESLTNAIDELTEKADRLESRQDSDIQVKADEFKYEIDRKEQIEDELRKEIAQLLGKLDALEQLYSAKGTDRTELNRTLEKQLKTANEQYTALEHQATLKDEEIQNNREALLLVEEYKSETERLTKENSVSFT